MVLTGSSLYAIGCIVLTITSMPSRLAAGWGLPGLIIAMVCIALGGGGFQGNMSAFLGMCALPPC